jgi:hypothetical protein
MRTAKGEGRRPLGRVSGVPRAGGAGDPAVQASPEPAADRTRTRPPARARRPAAVAAGSVLLLLFMASLLLPVRFSILGLLLTPDRLLLLIVFVPLALRLVNGQAGRVQPVDVFIMLYCFWIGLSLLVVHGPGQIPFIGVTIIELLGGYLVGRTMVRGSADYRTFFRYFAYGLLFMLPLVLIEQLTRRLLLSEILGTVFTTPAYVDYEQRLGLNRVQAVFEHPILFGIFCSVGVANLYYLNRRDHFRKALGLTGLAVFMSFMALSTAALISILMQTAMIVWDRIMRARWKLLAVLAVAMYVLIDLLSNRTPVEVLISYATLNSATAGMRLVIWEYGSASVLKHPVFGIGLNDWERIWWLHSPSVDNFWLVNAMRYGLPAVTLLIAGIVASLWRIFRRPDLPVEDADCRTGYAVAAMALFLTLATVHVWGPVSVFFMFYLGAGVWLAEAGRDPDRPARRGGRGTGGAESGPEGGHQGARAARRERAIGARTGR